MLERLFGRRTFVEWSRLLRAFHNREITSVLFAALCGAITACLIRLLFSDRAFESFLTIQYLPSAALFDKPSRYIPYLLTILVVAALIIILRIPRTVGRGLRSWAYGVTSGMRFVTFVATIGAMNLFSYGIYGQMAVDLVIVLIFFLAAFLLHVRALQASARPPDEEDIRVSVQSIGSPSPELSESDEPIKTWSEDKIGRAAIVDNLTITILISKAPVIGLVGDFGSGKTSVLNLLREHLGGKAIIVSFSTWLPGSDETLASYLMADIANECQKTYMVPGLRKSLNRLAKALSQSVSVLRGLSELLPTDTQRDDIEHLKFALSRLPTRVVVLLDELDRMEHDEIRTLLKVVRGISYLPNLSFVCAAEKSKLVETIGGDVSNASQVYFEKFFPVEVAIPKVDARDLQRAGVERIISALRRRKWFNNEAEVEGVRDQLNKAWDKKIGPFCQTLRSIGLLANDVGIAAAPLRREVDPVDLVLIETLKRFKPRVYNLVSQNSLTLTGGESMLKGGTYHTDEEKKLASDRFRAEVKSLTERESEHEAISNLLAELFPLFAKGERQSWLLQRESVKRVDEEKRIAQAGMFPAYFRYALPAAMYSAVELEEFARQTKALTTDQQRRELFVKELRSMERGSLKRDDFLKKVSEAIKVEDMDVSRSWALAAISAANEVLYDSFVGLGEAGHVIRMVIRYASRLKRPDRITFLREDIDAAADDTLAYRILRVLTDPKSDADLDVTYAELYPAFIQRMRQRYGIEVNASTLDLSTSDPRAFDEWAATDLSANGVSVDPEDQSIQRDFWKRYLSSAARSKFITTFNQILMPFYIYQTDPEPHVERKVSVELIRKLYAELPDDADMSQVPRKYKVRLYRFLRGDFKNGIPMEDVDGDDSSVTDDDLDTR